MKYFIIGSEKLEIIKIGPRNELTPLPGVNLIGNAVICKELDGSLSAFCEWDGEIVEE